MADGSNIMPLIWNIILSSVPEVTFLTMFSLMVLKRFDLLEPKKANILRLAAVIVISAVFSNILRFYSIIDAAVAPVCGILFTFLLIVTAFGIKSPAGIIKSFLSVCAAFLVAIVLEIAVYPLLSSIPGFSADLSKTYGWLTIVLTIPERVIQLIIVAVILLKRRGFMKLGFFKVITRNKPLAIITAGLVIFNFIFVYIMFRLIFIESILAGTDMVIRVLVVSLVISFPLLNMSVLLGVINYSVNKYTHTRLYVQEETRVLRVLVHTLLQQQRYSEVDLQMESFVDEIKKIK